MVRAKSDYIARAFEILRVDAETALGESRAKIVGEALTSHNTYGGSGMWLQIETEYLEVVSQFGNDLSQLLTTPENAKHHVRPAHFTLAQEQLQSFADRAKFVYQRANDKSAQSGNSTARSFNAKRAAQAVDKWNNELAAKERVFMSERSMTAKAKGVAKWILADIWRYLGPLVWMTTGALIWGLFPEFVSSLRLPGAN